MDAFVTRRTDVAATELERPSKRVKREISDSEDDEPIWEHKELNDDIDQRHGRATDFENALPDAPGEAEAEYEAIKSSQEVKAPALWVRGRSSIYVDAFNLALDTVLEEESHLFDEQEKDVFRQWRELDYEAQYLYVRLFLRKTASWHRSSRLGYHSDISDLDASIKTLQEARPLPVACTQVADQAPFMVEEEPQFGEIFTFADASENHITTVEEAAPLLLLDELKTVAKEAKVQGRNKAELVKVLVRMSEQQAGLMSLGLSRHNSRDSADSEREQKPKPKVKLRREDSNRKQHFLNKILEILGPCVRLSPRTFTLFERVHLVFYRSTEWTEKSLTTIILAKIARRNFPEYIVCRTSTIFASRAHLVEFEGAIRLEADVDGVLEFNGPPGEEGHQKIIDILERVYPRWKLLVAEESEKEQKVYEMGEGAYLRRFTPGHSYTRIVHKALNILARRKEHAREHNILSELLEQRLFHAARRGAWYQRRALLEEHYMADLDASQDHLPPETRKRHWRNVAIATCEAGLQDPDCHLIHHYDLQKRLMKLEKRARVPKRLQHDFGHVRLASPLELTVEGIQIKREGVIRPGRVAASTKTIWLDELDTGEECSVEEMCLSHFRHKEGWKGYHSEGGIVRTLFAYLFYDILFLYVPNVFQTAYQTCPLDLHTDAFFPARASEINHRLASIANGSGARLIRAVWEREHARRTSVAGLNWDFDIEDLVELTGSFDGAALAAVCKVMAQEYRHRGGGMPDLLLWREGTGEVMFVEVKSAGDRLSDTQRLWMHVLTGAGVRVGLCSAVAREVRALS